VEQTRLTTAKGSECASELCQPENHCSISSSLWPAPFIAALIGAIAWDLLTWYYGLPSSSSHALVAGLAGAAVSFNGVGMLKGAGITKTALFIVISPVVGFVISVLLMKFDASGRPENHVEQTGDSGRHQLAVSQTATLVGCGLLSGSRRQRRTKNYGDNRRRDSHRSGASIRDFELTLPIVLAAHTAIALGTLSGGWRIVHTLGSKITKLQPIGGFSAGTAAAATLFTTAHSVSRCRRPIPSPGRS